MSPTTFGARVVDGITIAKDAGPHCIVCDRCGGTHPLTLPIDARELVKRIDQFTRGHSRCLGIKPKAKKSKVALPIYLGSSMVERGNLRSFTLRWSAPHIAADKSALIEAHREFDPSLADWAIRVDNVVLPSRNNLGEHWRDRNNRSQVQRALMREIASRMCPVGVAAFAPPFSVRFTRIAPRLLDAGDNDAGAFKSIRDGLADALRVSDGPRGGVTWLYASRKRVGLEPTGFSVEIWK